MKMICYLPQCQRKCTGELSNGPKPYFTLIKKMENKKESQIISEIQVKFLEIC